MQPLVSIILPCYNAELFIKYSLDSIINQDYKNLEIICINDGSFDKTLDILNDYKKSDDRIVIVNNEKNSGLIVSLNKGLSYVKGDYFARMDADDYSVPDRITEQVKFMQLHGDIDLVSSAYHYFKNAGKKNNYVAPIASKPGALKFLSLFCTPLTHASVFGKTSLITSGLYVYNPAYPHAEDYELFSRLVWNNIKVATIKKSLYWVRLHSDSVSVLHNDVQLQTNLAITKRNIETYFKENGTIDPTVLGLLSCRISNTVSIEQLKQVFALFESYFNTVKVNLTKEECDEIEAFLLQHKLNIIIQSNKLRFKKIGFVHSFFFAIRTLLFLNLKQISYLIKKI